MAQETIEGVRFTVRPDAEEAVRAEFPGKLRARLAKVDETTWLELIVWTSREAAQRATEKAHDIPAVAAWGRSPTTSRARRSTRSSAPR